MRLLRAATLALVAVMLPQAAAAQETYTYYFHQENSDYSFGFYGLKATPADTPAFVIQANLTTNTNYWAGLPNTPNIKFLPSGTTFTITLYMRKTGSSGVVYPRADVLLNWGPSDFFIGGAWYAYFFCNQVGTSALTTAFAPYTFSCTTQRETLLGSFDRIFVSPGYYVAQNPGGNKTVFGEFAMEGTGSPSYPSRIVVTVPPNPRITSATPTVGPTGTLVTINGANFGTGGQVTFNGVPVAPSSWTSTQIRVPAPAGNRALIRVTANNLSSNPWTYVGAFDTARCQPQLASQRLGPVSAGGGSINLAVTADAGCSWTVESVSPSWLSVSPASGSGPGTITVTVPSWNASDPRGGSFSVNGIPVAVTQNGTAYPAGYLVYSPTPTLTITGGQVHCSADADNSRSYTSLQGMDLYADGQLIASTWGGGDDYLLDISTWPAGYVSSFYCVVYSIPDGYILAQNTVQNAGPHLISLNPSAGRVNSAVMLTGTGFGIGPGAVRFNGTPTTSILSWTDTKIYVGVPAGATSGPVVITDNNGQLSNALEFTVRDLADPGGQLSYYHTDAIGSVRMITDMSGQIVSRYDYVPFGQDFPTSPGGDLNTINFADKERDRETGAEGVPWSPLDYFGTRYYHGQTGRFTRPDDPGFMDPFNPQSMNLYSYALNSPLRFGDPTGNDPCPIVQPDNSVCVEGKDPGFDPGTRRFFWDSLFGNRSTPTSEPSSSGIVALAQGVRRGAGPVTDPRFMVGWYGASALVGGAGALGSLALSSTSITTLGIGAIPILPAVPTAIDKLQRIGLTVAQASRMATSLSSQKFVDTANSNNINVIQQVGDKLVRITLDPTGQRIISAGYVQARNVANSVASGRFIPK